MATYPAGPLLPDGRFYSSLQGPLLPNGQFYSSNPYPQAPAPQPQNDGGGQPQQPQQPQGPTEQELAEQARRNRIDSIRAQAGATRDAAQSNFQRILDAVKAYRDRAGTLRTNSNQENIDTASQILGSNARSGREAAGQARAQGRAMGLGDSSKFLKQNQLRGDLVAQQGATIAQRGQNERTNDALYQERLDQAQDQERSANNALSAATTEAANLEKFGYDQAENDYQSALNNILNYQRQLAALTPLNSSGLTSSAPDYSGILNGVNSALAATNAASTVGNQAGNSAANPVNPTNIFDLIRNRGLLGAIGLR